MHNTHPTLPTDTQFVTRAYGFQRQEIRILTDDPSFTDGAPTRHNIIESMRWLVYGAQPGDSLLLHYSGHGGSVRDRNGDEVDSKCAMCACVCRTMTRTVCSKGARAPSGRAVI